MHSFCEQVLTLVSLQAEMNRLTMQPLSKGARIHYIYPG